MTIINPNQPTHTMNNDNIIEEIIARLKKRFDTDNLWKSDDGETAYLAIGNLWEALTEEMSTALLEVHASAEQQGYSRAMGEAREVVVCAAVMASDGSIYRGHRHGHAMQAVRDEKKELMRDERQQGFITTNNRYVSREEARKLQDSAGIPSADKDGYRYNTLFSEDLYQAHKDVVLTSTDNNKEASN